VTQPLDRNVELPALGEIDADSGEFWAENAFQMPANGQNLSAYERNRLFVNLQGRGFLDVSFAAVADIDSDSRSVVAADFDRDGAPDLLVGSVGGGPLRLFRNRFPEGNFRLRVELVGVASNRQGIGARVIAEVGERKIVRDLFPANGGTGLGPAELELGLGTARQVDRLIVRWPTGEEQHLADVPAGGKVTLTEGKPGFAVSGFAPTSH